MGLDRKEIEDAFRTACRAELDALKPGNVHRFQGGHHMSVSQFEEASDVAAPHIADSHLDIGERILKATEASVAVTGLNANLGIVLLAAPLAKAAAETGLDMGLRRRLAILLGQLTVTDARNAFAAIRAANPAGLGKVDKGDISQSGPDMTLIEAMHLASDRDRIARAYVTAYEDVFDFALPTFTEALTSYGTALNDAEARRWATTTLHMRLLGEFADSHILRKFGESVALGVRDEAHRLISDFGPFAAPQNDATLLNFDRQLKDRGLNPGTTADFVVATLFTHLLSSRKRP